MDVFEVTRYAHGWYLESQGITVDVFEVTRYVHGWYLKKGLEPQKAAGRAPVVWCVCAWCERRAGNLLSKWEITSRHVLQPDPYS